MPDKEAAVLAVSEICIDIIIALYHTSLFAGHQGVVKIYLTMKDKFFIPNLMHYLRSFIKRMSYTLTIQIWQTANKTVGASNLFKLQTLSKLSMDLKVMPRSQKGTQVYLMHHWQNDKLFDHCPYSSFKIRKSRRSTHILCHIQNLCSWLYYHGSR